MLKINMEFRKGILFIRLKGNLTIYNCPSFNNYLIPLIQNQGIKYVVFNLEKVKVLDNYGKEAIARIIDMAKSHLGKGLICHTRTVFNDNIKIIDNELSALEIIKV